MYVMCMLCVYAFMYVPVCVCTIINNDDQICLYSSVSTYLCVYMWLYTYSCMYVMCICVSMHSSMHPYASGQTSTMDIKH